MTAADQIKISVRKIKQNEAQYDLDRKAANIPASSSNGSDKYEYLTDQDLDFEPSTVEETRFEYFRLSKIFNKGLKEERLLKRLKSIKDKNEEQLKATKNKTENIKEVTEFVKNPLSLEAKGLTEEIKIMQLQKNVYK